MARSKKGRFLEVFGWIGAVAAVIFTALSLFSFILGKNRPASNYGGVAGYHLARALINLFGGMSVVVPLLAGAALAVKLIRRRWRRFSAFGILTATIFLGAAFLSFYAGLKTTEDNFSGWLGHSLSTLLLPLFGLGALTIVALGFYWGFTLWFRRTKPVDLERSGLIILAGFLLQLYCAFFHTSATVAGAVGNSTIRLLARYFGNPGTLILLLIALIVLVLTSGRSIPGIVRPVTLLRKIRLPFRRPKRLRIVTPAPPVPEKPAETAAAVHTEFSPEVAQPSPRPRNLARAVDPDRFQKMFLEHLDTPLGPEAGVPEAVRVFKDPAEAEAEGAQLMKKLKEFGVDGKLTAILSGPMITRFELEPAPGVRCSGIESLADDIALALSAERVRILAPIPGKSAVGIEIPNKTRRTVHLKEVLTSSAFGEIDSPLGFALGTSITGEPYCADLRSMPHILIAGTTGSGKSVCINSIIMSMIYRSTPDEVRLLTIDPKQLELPIYNPIPHLLSKTTTNPELVVQELTRIVNIMEARYSEFAELGVRDIAGYNARCAELGKKKKPYIVVVIDELADLMQRAPAEIEARIIRLAQMSRAVGIHLILATQRPSVDVITGLIKANFPCRIAFQVATKVDSRTILDANGAESLLGRGDMLFLPPGKGDPIRLHGCFVSERACKGAVDLWASRYLTEILSEFLSEPEEKAREIVRQELTDVLYDVRAARGRKREALSSIIPEEIIDIIISRGYYQPLEEEVLAKHLPGTEDAGYAGEYDPRFADAARLVVLHQEASVSMLQRRLDVGWARAGRIIDQLERAGIVGPHAGSKPRKVLIKDEAELAEKLSEVLKQND